MCMLYSKLKCPSPHHAVRHRMSMRAMNSNRFGTRRCYEGRRHGVLKKPPKVSAQKKIKPSATVCTKNCQRSLSRPNKKFAILPTTPARRRSNCNWRLVARRNKRQRHWNVKLQKDTPHRWPSICIERRCQCGCTKKSEEGT